MNVSGMPAQPAFVELRLSKRWAMDEDAVWVNEVVTSTCCRLDLQNTSDEFRETWTAIERLLGTSTSTRSLRGLEVPVRLVVDEFNDGSGVAVLAQTWEVVRDVMDQNQISWGWASSNLEKPASCSKGSLRDCFSSFVLDSISAEHLSMENTFLHDEIKPTFIQLVGEMAGRVRFSDVTFPLLLLEKNAATAGRLCRMISRILCIKSCSNVLQERKCMANVVEVRYTTTWPFNAFCAALAVTQSCQSIHVFKLDDDNDYTRATAWRWLAYALFSKRARACSSVRKIKLTKAHLSSEDAEAMAQMIIRDSHEHELISSETLTSVAVPDEAEYHVDENAVVQIYDRVSFMLGSSESFQIGRTCGIKLVGADDGASEWVDAIAPGIGWCKIQRTSLVRCHSRAVHDRQNPLQLKMQMAGSWSGVPRLLELVGSSLQTLRLTLLMDSKVLDISWILSSCPILEELTVQHELVSAEAFVKSCNEHKSRLRRLQIGFDDYKIVANVLKDDSHHLTKHLQWWYCPCLSFTGKRSPVAPLQDMLNVNRLLRWLTIETIPDDTKKSATLLMGYNGQQLDVAVEKLSTTCKLAFLSVFDSREEPHLPKKRKSTLLQAPDGYSLSRIFQFATDRAVRSVEVVYVY